MLLFIFNIYNLSRMIFCLIFWFKIGRSNCRFWYELFMIRSPRLASEASEVEQIIPDLRIWVLLMQGSAHYHHRRITRFGIRSIRSISQEGDNPRFVLDPNKGRGIPPSSIQDPLWIAQNRDNTLLCGFWQIKVIAKHKLTHNLKWFQCWNLTMGSAIKTLTW